MWVEISGCNKLCVQSNLGVLSGVQWKRVQLKVGADEFGADSWVETNGCKSQWVQTIWNMSFYYLVIVLFIHMIY